MHKEVLLWTQSQDWDGPVAGTAGSHALFHCGSFSCWRRRARGAVDLGGPVRRGGIRRRRGLPRPGSPPLERVSRASPVWWTATTIRLISRCSRYPPRGSWRGRSGPGPVAGLGGAVAPGALALIPVARLGAADDPSTVLRRPGDGAPPLAFPSGNRCERLGAGGPARLRIQLSFPLITYYDRGGIKI